MGSSGKFRFTVIYTLNELRRAPGKAQCWKMLCSPVFIESPSAGKGKKNSTC